jgi:hypothetical protein
VANVRSLAHAHIDITRRDRGDLGTARGEPAAKEFERLGRSPSGRITPDAARLGESPRED